jgi:hypothetical protein
MRTLWLAIRLYPESAAARRLVIVSLLGLFFAAAGTAALLALVYRNSPAPGVLIPLLELIVSMERPGALLAIMGPLLLLSGAAIFWLTLAHFRDEFLPDTDEAYKLLLLQLMALERERDRSSVLLIGDGPRHRAVAVAIARTSLDLRVLRLGDGRPEREYLLALARNEALLAERLGAPGAVAAAPPVATALDEVYPLRARLVEYTPALEAADLRRLLGTPGLIAATVEDAEGVGPIYRGSLGEYLATVAAPKLIVLPTVAREDAETLLGRLDPERLFDTVVVNAARSSLGGGRPDLPFLAFDRGRLREVGYTVHEVPLVDWDDPARWSPEDVATALFAELARRLLRKVPPPRR